VAAEVLALTELQAVDEDAGDDRVGVLARFVHQRDVALVQVAHGGDEGDAPGPGTGGATGGDGFEGLHGGPGGDFVGARLCRAIPACGLAAAEPRSYGVSNRALRSGKRLRALRARNWRWLPRC